MATLTELLDFLFDGNRPPLAAEIESWLKDLRRFKAFVMTYQVKIRAKLRNAHDDSGLMDLRAELETAYFLLGDERFALEYEHYTALKQRGPDYTVTFRTSPH